MTFAIPAAPGTYLCQLEDREDAHTVVGWLVHPGGVASPITLNRIDDLSAYVVMHPDTSKPEAFGAAQSAPPAPKSAPARASTPEKPKTAPAASGGPVSLSGKEYAKKTFWQIDGQGVLIVEGGNPVPVGDGVTKITRDDYFKVRKELRELVYDTLALDGFGEPGDSPETEDDDDDLI